MPLLNLYRNPPQEKCHKAPSVWGFGLGHSWEFSTSWNSNTRSILPWVRRTSGIVRAGWRCSHCGKMYWAVDDAAFAEQYAMSTDPRMKFTLNQRRGLDRWGRELSHYDRCVTFKGKPFVVTQTDEAITVRCNGDIVARWSFGEPRHDYDYFCDWIEITGVKVEGLEEVVDPEEGYIAA